jgi:tetratricopeptide (TPR) repeat protein
VRNEIELALGDLRRALALDPNHFKALDGLGQILREIGQKKAALKAFKQLLEVHPYWSGAQQLVDELAREVEGQGI